MQEPSQLKSNSDLSENAQFHSPPGGRAPFPAICFSCVCENSKQPPMVSRDQGILPGNHAPPKSSAIQHPTQVTKQSQCHGKDQGMMFLIKKKTKKKENKKKQKEQGMEK